MNPMHADTHRSELLYQLVRTPRSPRPMHEARACRHTSIRTTIQTAEPPLPPTQCMNHMHADIPHLRCIDDIHTCMRDPSRDDLASDAA